MSEKVQNIRQSHKLHYESHRKWKAESAAGGKALVEEKIQRGIFQGDLLLPLLFVIAMRPFNYIHKKYTGSYKFTKSQEKINQFMDDIKIFVQNEIAQETLIHKIRIYIQDKGIEFDIVKCAMLEMKSGKRETTEGIELPNQESIRILGKKENHKYLGILEAVTK